MLSLQLSLVLSLAFFGNRHRVHVPLVSGGPRVRTVRVTEPAVIEEDQNHDNAPEVVTIADDEPSTLSVTLSPMWGSQAAESLHGSL